MKVFLLNPSSLLEITAGSYSKEMTPMPPLGLAYLAAVARAGGHEVFVEDQYASRLGSREVAESILRLEADLLGVSCMSPNMPTVREVIGMVKSKRPEIHITLGNVHATFFARELIEHLPVDSVVLGEGEDTFAELLEKLAAGASLEEVAGLLLRHDGAALATPPRPLIENLDRLPRPAWDIFKLGDYPAPARLPIRGHTLAIQAARGCPWNCDFCSQNLFSKGVRRRSLEAVVDEISWLHHELGVSAFGFQDAVFPLSEKEGLRFCRLLAEKGLKGKIRWFTETRPDLVSFELLKQMKEHGCAFIMYGFESASARLLDECGKKLDKESAFRAMGYMKRLRFSAYGLFMIGFPDESAEEARATMEYAKKLDCDVASFSRVTPYPGTRLYEKYKDRFSEDIEPWKWNNQYRPREGEPIWRLPGLSHSRINALLTEAMVGYYLRPRMIVRHVLGGSFSLGEMAKGFILLMKDYLARGEPAGSGADPAPTGQSQANGSPKDPRKLPEKLLFPLLLVLSVIAALLRASYFGLLSDGPPMLENYAKHVYFIDLHIRTFRETGTFWGYDPTFAAGCLTGPGWSVSFLFNVIVGWLTSLGGAALIKAHVTAYFILSPLSVWLAARLFGLGRREAAIAGLLILGTDHLGLRSFMVMGSMCGYWSAAALALPAAALAWRLSIERPRRLAIAAIVFTALLLCVSLNPHAVWPLLILLGGVWIHRGRVLLGLPILFIALASALAALALLWPFLSPGIVFVRSIFPWCKQLASFLSIEASPVLGWGGFLILLQPLSLFILISGAAGILRLRRSENPLASYFIGVLSALLLLIVAHLLSGMAPYVFVTRFISFSLNILALPAACFILARIGTRGGEKIVFGAMGAFLVQALLFGALTVGKRKIQGEAFYELVSRLRERTDERARILAESSLNPSSQPLGFDFAAYLPYFLPGRKFLNLPTVDGSGIAYSSFLSEGLLSWLPIEGYTDKELKEYFKTYNVGWVLAYDSRYVERFERSDALRRDGRLGAFSLFTTTHEPSFFLSGNGRVEADLNRIRLSRLRPDDSGKVVLSYNWFPSLKSAEGVPLYEKKWPFSPFGLIELRNPPESVTIVNDTQGGFPALNGDPAHFMNPLFRRYEELCLASDAPFGSGPLKRASCDSLPEADGRRRP